MGGGTSRHCFTNLAPNTRYKISVYAQLQDGFEGPAVTATENTREFTLRRATSESGGLKLGLVHRFFFFLVCKRII